MAERIPSTYIEQSGKDIRVIDRLVHEIQNDLQVINMEAELLLRGERSKRGLNVLLMPLKTLRDC